MLVFAMEDSSVKWGKRVTGLIPYIVVDSDEQIFQVWPKKKKQHWINVETNI